MNRGPGFRKVEPARDLFGERRGEDDGGDVELLMTVTVETSRAWALVSKTKGGSARWVPKSMVRRSAAPHEDVFTMPRFMARERGWL